MKCPKCGYVSFDYNQTCPKCNKDISEERSRLNLPEYAPTFPFFLSALAGGMDEGSLDLASTSMGMAAAAAVSTPEEVFDAPEEEISFEEETPPAPEDELEISLSEDWSTDALTEEPPAVEDFDELDEQGAALRDEAVVDEDLPELDLGFDGTDLSIEEDATAQPVGMDVGTDEEITFDLDEDTPREKVGLEEPPADESSLDDDLSLDLEGLGTDEDISLDMEPSIEEAPPSLEEDLAIDLDELSLDEEELGESLELDDAAPTIEDLEPDEDHTPGDTGEESLGEALTAEDEDEVILELEDLKVNETGELEIGSVKGKSSEDSVVSFEDKETSLLEDDTLNSAEDLQLEPTDGSEADDDLMLELDGLLLEEESEDFGLEEDDGTPPDLEDLELELDLENEQEPKE